MTGQPATPRVDKPEKASATQECECEECEGDATAAQPAASDAGAEVDLLIIGAGASGVGCGVLAAKFGVDPARTLIVERGSSVGASFDKWPGEMRFITPSFNQQAFGMMDLNCEYSCLNSHSVDLNSHPEL